jgi:hypothetical protein
MGVQMMSALGHFRPILPGLLAGPCPLRPESRQVITSQRTDAKAMSDMAEVCSPSNLSFVKDRQVEVCYLLKIAMGIIHLGRA